LDIGQWQRLNLLRAEHRAGTPGLQAEKDERECQRQIFRRLVGFGADDRSREDGVWSWKLLRRAEVLAIGQHGRNGCPRVDMMREGKPCAALGGQLRAEPARS